jgi:hypothetical protein
MKARSVVRIIVVICVGLSAVWVLAVYLFNRSSRRDEAKFDSVLCTQLVERIEIVLIDKTNSILPKDLELFLTSLNRSNRVREHVFTKDQVSSSFRVVSQTNAVFWITLLDSGILKFGDYTFRLKSWPSYSVTE